MSCVFVCVFNCESYISLSVYTFVYIIIMEKFCAHKLGNISAALLPVLYYVHKVLCIYTQE